MCNGQKPLITKDLNKGQRWISRQVGIGANTKMGSPGAGRSRQQLCLLHTGRLRFTAPGQGLKLLLQVAKSGIRGRSDANRFRIFLAMKRVDCPCRRFDCLVEPRFSSLGSCQLAGSGKVADEANFAGHASRGSAMPLELLPQP